MTAPELYALLKLRFPLPEWAVFRQVCEAGTGGHRYADAMALNLFPSRGMEFMGFEIKVSRGDWLREVRDPEKADALAKFCDRWWLVVSDPKIVKDGELPPTWGLLAPRAGTLYTLVQAPKLEAQPLSREMVVTLLRRATGDADFSMDEAFQQAVKKEVEQRSKWLNERAEKDLEPLRQLEESLGCTLQSLDWRGRTPREAGAALRLLVEGKAQVKEYFDAVEYSRNNLLAAQRELDAILAARPRITEPSTPEDA